MTIVAAVSAGSAGHLMVGRNGVFYDRKGQDWDATIVRIVDNPISIREAFWSPYRRMGKMISEQMQKMATSKDQAITAKAAADISDVGSKSGVPALPVPAFDIGKMVGIFAAIGLAVGAIGTALAAILGGFLALHVWQMPLAIAGILLLISGPSMILAWFKLRARNLGPILDANAWAVNTQAKINIPFGTSLTSLAKLPPGAERALTDPYASKKHTLLWVLLLLLVIGCYVGCKYALFDAPKPAVVTAPAAGK